ncbi:hypothetical protein BC827DRAFT_1212122, partial [Russula dissimulans]
MAKKVAKNTRKNKAKDTVTGSECQRVGQPAWVAGTGARAYRYYRWPSQYPYKPILLPTRGY